MNGILEAVDMFNDWACKRGYWANLAFHHWGDWTIDVFLDDHRVATVYDNLAEFEQVARRVDEGEFEPLVMEVA